MFSVKHLTVKKGQRMVVPVTEFTLKYKDVYALNIPFSPPPEVWRNFGNNPQQEELNDCSMPPRSCTASV